MFAPKLEFPVVLAVFRGSDDPRRPSRSSSVVKRSRVEIYTGFVEASKLSVDSVVEFDPKR